MEFHELIERALRVRAQYAELEQARYGRSWSSTELALGFVGEGSQRLHATSPNLCPCRQVQNGVRAIPEAHEKLAHELCDCLWCVIVLAHQYGFDLEAIFLENMDALEKSIAQQKRSD